MSGSSTFVYFVARPICRPGPSLYATHVFQYRVSIWKPGF